MQCDIRVSGRVTVSGSLQMRLFAGRYRLTDVGWMAIPRWAVPLYKPTVRLTLRCG